jgi:hypothetical protein
VRDRHIRVRTNERERERKTVRASVRATGSWSVKDSHRLVNDVQSSNPISQPCAYTSRNSSSSFSEPTQPDEFRVP